MRRSVYGESIRGPLVGARFFSQVDTKQQGAFLVEGFDRCQESLQPFEVDFPPAIGWSLPARLSGKLGGARNAYS